VCCMRVCATVLVTVAAGVFLYGSPRVQAQNPPLLITQSIDDTRLVTLGGNTRPEAKAKFDRGPVANSLPMDHLLLLLKRSPGQERALEALIEQLHNLSSPKYHQWLTAQE
jgi:hypothetical protein